jgi:alkaline phosphatase
MKANKFKTVASALLVGAMVFGSVMPAMAGQEDRVTLTGKGKEVKNVILMISDGWGSNQILATDFYTGGKAGTQIYERFPVKVDMSTYSFGGLGTDDDNVSMYTPELWSDFELLKNHPTDSAAAGTAMSTGTKTYDAAIGVDQEQKDLRHIAEDFEDKGRSTGVISSVEFSHATPASFVDHDTNRNNYSDIANGMIKDSATDVIMGAGNPWFDDNGQAKTTGSYKYVGGQETWEALFAGTLGSDADGDGDIDNWSLIQTKEEFEDLQTGDTPDRLIGVPQVYTTLQQARGGKADADAYAVPFNDNVPNLDVMARGALNVLDNDEDGFFLMIEGGAIDWAGHANQSGRLIEEQADFNEAVEAVCKWVNKNSSWSETLVIVTGDHETGYLTGTAGVYDEVINNGRGEMPAMAWNSGDHTNQLIPFYAKGAGAEIFKKHADETDPVKGAYLDNTEITIAIRALID